MDWTIFYALVGLLAFQDAHAGSNWHKSCPGSYEEWTQVLAETDSTPIVFSASRLSMTFLEQRELANGYKPSGKYEVTLKIHPDHHEQSKDFVISAVGERDCGSGLFVGDENDLDVRQMYCLHRVHNLTKHHVRLIWKAPECGCVKFMVGAVIGKQKVIGDDFYFSGKQAHKLCPTLEEETEDSDDLENILDPKYYGIEESKLTKEESATKKEVESLKKIYKTKVAKSKAAMMGHQNHTHIDVKCRGPMCRKINRIAGKHHRQYNRLKKWPKKLCMLAGSPLPIKPRVYKVLDEQRQAWVHAWKKWKVNIGRCCKEDNSTEMNDCLALIGPLPVPWTRKIIQSKENAGTVHTSPEEELTSLCRKVSALEWNLELGREKFHDGNLLKQWGETWHRRRDGIMDCCELSDLEDRMECITDIRAEKIDDKCAGRRTPLPGRMTDDNKLAKKNRRLSKKCCKLEDDERYNCFSVLYKWGNSSKSLNQPRRNKRDKKPGSKEAHHQCCKQGKIVGIEVQQRRWAKCNHKAMTFLQATLKDLAGKQKGVCKKKFRRCCLRQSKRTIVEDPLPVTAIPTSMLTVEEIVLRTGFV